MNTYTNRFGGANVSPAMLTYVALAMTVDTTLVWPFQTGLSEDFAAAKIDVTSSSAFPFLVLTFPDARLVSTGQDILVNNVGSHTITVHSADGTTLGTVASGEQWFYYLTDNSTEGGTWRSTQFGMGTSSATAGTLAGYGLYADTTSLNQVAPYVAYNADQAFGASARAGAYASTGGAITFAFAAAATLGNGWFAFFRNDGTGSLTLTPNGAETIDGSATKVLGLGESCIVISTSAALITFGFGRSLASTTAAVSIDIGGSGDHVLDANEIAAVIQDYTGTLTGATTVTIGTAPGYFFVYNNTSGAFTTTFRVNGGDVGAVVAQGTYSIIRTDGTNATVAFSATSGTVTSVGTGTDLTGGPITTAGTIVHAASGVTGGTYGDASHTVTVAVNARGHITTIAANVIAATWAAITGIPAAIAAIAALTPAADRLAYFTGATTAALATFTAYARTLVAAVDAAAARVVLGLGTSAVLDVGTTANKVVQLNGSAQLPAVDGSLLIGVERLAGGLLTLVTGVPVMTGNTAAAGIVYYAPYTHDTIPIYDGAAFAMTPFTQLSNVLANSATGSAGPAAATTNSNYDLFVWSNAGVLTLTRGPLWTSDTARGAGAGTSQLTRVKGIYTNTVAITNGPGAGLGTYVGTVRTNGTSTVDWTPKPAAASGGALASLHVFNAYNRHTINAFTQDSVASWTYGTATWQALNASNTNRISYIDGLAECDVRADLYCVATTAATVHSFGIVRDSIVAAPVAAASTANGTTSATAWDSFAPSLGYHYLQAMEYDAGGGGSTMYGSGNFSGQPNPGSNLNGFGATVML